MTDSIILVENSISLEKSLMRYLLSVMKNILFQLPLCSWQSPTLTFPSISSNLIIDSCKYIFHPLKFLMDFLQDGSEAFRIQNSSFCAIYYVERISLLIRQSNFKPIYHLIYFCLIISSNDIYSKPEIRSFFIYSFFPEIC